MEAPPAVAAVSPCHQSTRRTTHPLAGARALGVGGSSWSPPPSLPALGHLPRCTQTNPTHPAHPQHHNNCRHMSEKQVFFPLTSHSLTFRTYFPTNRAPPPPSPTINKKAVSLCNLYTKCCLWCPRVGVHGMGVPRGQSLGTGTQHPGLWVFPMHADAVKTMAGLGLAQGQQQPLVLQCGWLPIFQVLSMPSRARMWPRPCLW